MPTCHPQEAAAKGGEYGLIEGKGVALIHPIMMAGVFLFTVYTGYQASASCFVHATMNCRFPVLEPVFQIFMFQTNRACQVCTYTLEEFFERERGSIHGV
jgi:hypothetical protein